MDAITHLLVGYLLGEALFDAPALVAFAAFMAVFPDFDTIAWIVKPLGRHLPHRGPTHALVVGGAVSLAGALGLSALGHGAFLPLLAAGSLGFLSHVALDVLNWGCAALWPFRRERVAWTVQQGLLGPAVASTAAWAVIGLASAFALPQRDLLVPVLGALALAYLAFRVGTRLRVRARVGSRATIFPTGSPLDWRVIVEAGDGDERSAALYRYRLARGFTLETACTYRVAPLRPPIASPADAAQYAYHVPEVSRLREALGPLHATVSTTHGGWLVRWRSAWSPWRDGAYVAEVRVSPAGAHEARVGWVPARALAQAQERPSAPAAEP